MASAKRLIEVRHSWRSSSRIAEIRVPAWPMPIHHTKLMMSMPQPTGIRTPQTPIPWNSRNPMASSSSWNTAKATAKPSHQPFGVFRCSTILEIWSVTVPKSWPGAISRSASVWCVSCRSGLATRHLRVRVPDRRQIGGAGPRVELGQQAVVAGLGLQQADPAPLVVDVAEDDGLGGARLLAGGADLAVRDGPVLVLRGDAGLVDPLHAVGALLHH